MSDSTARPRPASRWVTVVWAPFRELMSALDHVLSTPRDLLLVFLGLALGWWIYVPLHELLHAGACLLAGGSVTRLEIDPLYGGALLARVFPFVVAGGEYAGRLAGFDTGGSDLIYVLTVLGPFVLALLPGVWGLRTAAAAGRPLAVGLALPFAFAPLLSLPGDAYELGSIVLTNLGPWAAAPWPELLRGDDVGLRFEAVAAAVAAGTPAARAWGGFAGGLVLSLVWAWGTVIVAAALASLLGRSPLAARRPPQAAPGGAPGQPEGPVAADAAE